MQYLKGRRWERTAVLEEPFELCLEKRWPRACVYERSAWGWVTSKVFYVLLGCCTWCLCAWFGFIYLFIYLVNECLPDAFMCNHVHVWCLWRSEGDIGSSSYSGYELLALTSSDLKFFWFWGSIHCFRVNTSFLGLHPSHLNHRRGRHYLLLAKGKQGIFSYAHKRYLLVKS